MIDDKNDLYKSLAAWHGVRQKLLRISRKSSSVLTVKCVKNVRIVACTMHKVTIRH